ncbi:calcium-binding protein [Maliponia aquimaris]|uniref:Hemolysin, plasmid n=1 Tax=Maliponia aquimaris TaxID=1673631 RepID=A0A238L4Z2_9RHOB|nr:calcium-binding protein [Maliponia aquimaris]SMX49396.1 Hemolysin, plasmid [Maliponia aquimaris]
MAIVYVNTNTVGPGVRINTVSTPAVASGDTLIIDKEVAVISTTPGIAIDLSATTSSHVQNFGVVAGSRGIQMGGNQSSSSPFSIYNGVTGSITGTNHPIVVGGTSPAQAGFRFSLVNDGVIANDSASSGGIALYHSETVYFGNSGRITNFKRGTGEYYSAVTFFGVGTVNGWNSGVMDSAATSGAVQFIAGTQTVIFNNSGTINSAGLTIESTATLAERIDNSGILNGGILLSDTIGGTLGNSGAIWGDVNLRGGSDTYRGISNGTVSGTVLGGAGNDTLIGGETADRLNGGANDDQLFGRGGDDLLIGDDGNDLMLGGAGNDSMSGGTGNDTMNGQDGDDTMLGDAGNDAMTGGAGVDVMFGGADDDTMNGQDGEDNLEGEAGNDILRGGNGDDALAGGDGFDLLTGGQGVDSFVFRALSETAVGANRDQILDFQKGVDIIVVAGLSPGVFEFRGTAAFDPSGNPELRLFETTTGSTIVQFDADGNGTVDAEIRVANVIGLTATDFVL